LRKWWSLQDRDLHVEIDSFDQLFRTGDESESHSRTENFRERVESEDSAFGVHRQETGGTPRCKLKKKIHRVKKKVEKLINNWFVIQIDVFYLTVIYNFLQGAIYYNECLPLYKFQNKFRKPYCVILLSNNDFVNHTSSVSSWCATNV